MTDSLLSRLPTTGVHSAISNAADEDQDLGSAGVVLVPDHGNLIGGGKDGILYNLDRNNLGHDTWEPQFNLPFVATYLPNAPNGQAGLPTTTTADPNWPIVKLDRNRRRTDADPENRTTSTAHRSISSTQAARSCSSGAKTSGSRPTTSMLGTGASPASAPRARNLLRVRWMPPEACQAADWSCHPTARNRAAPWSGRPIRCRATPIRRSCAARWSPMMRSPSRTASGLRQLFHSEAKQDTNTGQFRQVRDPRRGQRQGLCRNLQQ